MKNLKLSVILGIITLCVLIAITFVINQINQLKQVNNFIYNASLYLKNNLDDDGRFVYKRNAKTLDIDTESYNIVRHCGILYSWYLLAQQTKSEKLKNNRIKASEYLIKNYLKKLNDNTYAVVSNKAEEKCNCNKAKLGASGLTLAGMSDLYKYNAVKKEILVGLGEFIIFMQKDNGDFYMGYDYDTKKIIEDSQSKYFPSEAALGLLYLNDVIPDEKWVSHAKKALIYRAKTNKHFVHWDFLAIKKLIETKNNGLSKDEILLFKQYVKEISSQVLSNRIDSKKSKLYGTYVDNSHPCSIATYIEGETAMFAITDDYLLKYKLLKVIKSQLHFLISVQILSRDSAFGGVPSDIDNNSQIIRIDNVQHSISAMIDYVLLYPVFKKDLFAI